MVDINGFTISPDRNAIGIRSYTVPGTDVVLPVRAEVAPLLIGAATEFNRTVEPLHPGWCWGYAYRAVRGASTPSFHAAGVAIDLNAPDHPLGAIGTFNPDQAEQIRGIARRYGLRWGGDYSGRHDEMHLEVILPRPAALDLVARIQNQPPTPPPAPPAPPAPAPVPGSRPTVRRGSTGPAVAELQRILDAWYPNLPRLAIDGAFGPATDARIRYMQQHAGLAVDGIAGTATWRCLLGH